MAIKKIFIPEEDITVYELAVVCSKTGVLCGQIKFADEQFENLPDNIRRHFK